MITVSIVEDEPELLQSIAQFINGSAGYRCVSSYQDAAEALRHLPKDRPDVVLMDINLVGMSGIDCVAKLRGAVPGMQIIMLTVYEDADRIFKAFAAGANGYLLKRQAPAKLLEAIQDVRAGGAPMSGAIARKVVATFQRTDSSNEAHLSPREKMVLDNLARGMTYKHIASDLQISVETVRTYIRRIYEKLQVQSRTEAVVKYLRH
jgi:DNA-binding NarL/FixJ family response regulator